MTLFLVLTSIISLASAALWFGLFKPTAKLFQDLRSLKTRVEVADDVLELERLWTELVYLNKECWHRSLVSEVRIIAAIIETKYTMMTQQVTKPQ